MASGCWVLDQIYLMADALGNESLGCMSLIVSCYGAFVSVASPRFLVRYLFLRGDLLLGWVVFDI